MNNIAMYQLIIRGCEYVIKVEIQIYYRSYQY